MADLLTQEIQDQIKDECGITNIRVIRTRRDSHDYPNLLLQGEDDSGFPFRGWLKEGEGVIDIRWKDELVTGWPDDVT